MIIQDASRSPGVPAGWETLHTSGTLTPRLAFLGSQGRAEGRGGKTTGVAFVESSVLCTEPRVHIFLFALTLTPQPQFIDEEAVQGLMGE